MTAQTADQEVLNVDFVVIGAGPVGETFAHGVAEGGASVAIVEHRLVGGDCAYYACKPSKALLRPVQVVNDSHRIAGVAPAVIQPEAVMARRDEPVGHYDDEPQIDALAEAGITVVRGKGVLAGQKTVEVQNPGEPARRVVANNAVVVTTGSTPNVPQEFDGVPVWASQDATAVQEVPKQLLVVGGGPVACEAAGWMAALGAEVTMLVRGQSLLGVMEPFAGKLVAQGLEQAGVQLRFGTQVTRVERPDGANTAPGLLKGGPVTVHTDTGETLTAQEVLVVTGRRPDVGALNLDSVGTTADEMLNGQGPDWLHLVGDASGDQHLTHMGNYAAQDLVDQLMDGAAPKAQPAVTQVVFTDPQVASVGLTQAAAVEQGYAVRTASADFERVVGATLQRDNPVGGMNIVVDQATNTLLGVTLVGGEVGEMLHAATIAVAGQVPVDVLRQAVAVFPTASQIWDAVLDRL